MRKPSPLGPKFGTWVKNPMLRTGRSGYTPCTYCGQLYTQQGIARHWDHCPKNPKNVVIL